MKTILLLLLIFTGLFAYPQKHEISLEDLIRFLDCSSHKLEKQLHRKGLKELPQDGNELSFYKRTKEKKITKQLCLTKTSDSCLLQYRTTEEKEYNSIMNDLDKLGFFYSSIKDSNRLFQKANISINTCVDRSEEMIVYSFEILRKQLPPSFSFNFLEDFFHLPSHEYLSFVFGNSNVKKDVFHFSEKEKSACSIVFPNTAMQLIIVWADQDNFRNIKMIMTGIAPDEHLQLAGQALQQNKWSSRQGVRLGMNLNDLNRINGIPVSLYGWETDRPGFLIRQKEDRLDLSRLTIQVFCLDCYEDSYYSDTGIINSRNLLKRNERAYVSALVIFP